MDAAISARGLALFVREMRTKEAEDRLYELWLHKVFDGTSYAEYRRKVVSINRNANMGDGRKRSLMADTMRILDGFNPEGVS